MTDQKQTKTPVKMELEEAGDLLHHWFGLSGAERMALIAFAEELENSSSLVETSVEQIVGFFFELNNCVNLHCVKSELIDANAIEEILSRHNNGHTLNVDEIDMLVRHIQTDRKLGLESKQSLQQEVQALVQEAVQAFQFQDRTKQRLEQVKTILILMADLLYEMEKKTTPVLEKSHNSPYEKQWLDQLIQHMKLGEVRERFIRTALFAQGYELFDTLDEKTTNVELTEDEDDIELF